MEHKQVINFGAGPAKLPKSVSAVLGIYIFFAFACAVIRKDKSCIPWRCALQT